MWRVVLVWRFCFFFFFSSRRRHTRFDCDWSSDVCSSDLKVDATLDVEPGLPDVEVNANQIKQVFVNLINNACQAIASDAPSGRIWITAKRAQDVIAVSVTDSGPGIPEDVAARVFEPFFTTKPEGEGTGLGLSICQGILKEHGGRITPENPPATRATLTVELPVGGPARWAYPARALPRAPPPTPPRAVHPGRAAPRARARRQARGLSGRASPAPRLGPGLPRRSESGATPHQGARRGARDRLAAREQASQGARAPG